MAIDPDEHAESSRAAPADRSASARTAPAGTFAELLRTLRRVAGLTQEELARRAGVGVRTLRDLETGHAVRPQRSTVDLLAAALSLSGRDREEFVAVSRLGAGGASVAPASSRGGVAVPLPHAPELIGRDGDRRRVAALLEVGSVVTLVGLAGVGKTGLGLAVAYDVEDRFPGGIAGVSITDGCTEADVLAAVAAVFGVARADQLPARLAGTGPALLVVDGAERGTLGAAAAVTWLRSVAPGLRVLATSRHPLGVAGEHTWPVAPLEVPPPGVGATEVARYAAAGLFLERLRRVRQHPVGPEESQTLAELVRRLGGLPLALELAAARGRVLELGEILTRYGDRVLDLGTGDPAGATLRDAVAASCRLLDPTEWACLQWLAVFFARWSMEMAEELLGQRCGGRDVVALVDRLVSLGLVSVRPGPTGMRFRLADVVRDFVLERSDLRPARARHAELMADLVTRTRHDPAGTPGNAAVTQLDYLSADLRAALDHATGTAPHTALRIATALTRWWRFRGRAPEGLAVLRGLLADPRTADADPQLRAEAERGVAYLTD